MERDDAVPRVHRGVGRILIMDDEPVIRETTGALCVSLGYEVVCEDNGKDTVRRLEAEARAGRPFRAVILDLTIRGGMGGQETAEAIRKLNLDIPVFVSSGYADNPVMADPQKYGFTASLRKPFRRRELSDLLSRYLTP